jgi:hypothetical protein
MFKKIALCIALLTAPLVASADIFKLGWDYPVPDARVGKFVIAWGVKSINDGGTYGAGKVEVPADARVASTPNLGKGVYFFAVKACTADGTLCSAWSNEVSGTALGPIGAPAGFKLESITYTAE